MRKQNQIRGNDFTFLNKRSKSGLNKEFQSDDIKIPAAS